jgi:hypothetical protein
MSERRVHGLTLVNGSGGFCHPGRTYDLRTKMNVGQAYVSLFQENYPTRTSFRAAAKKAKVGKRHALKVIDELVLTGTLIDPDTMKQDRLDEKVLTFHLSVEKEIFLLSLHTENPAQPNVSYAKELRDLHGTTVTVQFIGKWFLNRFDFSGRFCKPNLVPKDKFRPENLLRYMEFRLILEQLPDHSKFRWLDEKHIVNKDVAATKVRADPRTGCIPCIYVNGDFRDACNLFAIISANPRKSSPVAHSIGRENGNAASFLRFIEFLLARNSFNQGYVLIMDNASIHTGQEADIAEHLP